MRELPILFNTEMVRAILDDRKTCTRRVIKYDKACWDCGMDVVPGGCKHEKDRLYNNLKKEYGCYMYRASCEYNEYPSADTWHPSIHMPKKAARIWLKVTDVRVERLQEITEDGAKEEGANFKNGKNVGLKEKMNRTAIERFAEIWNSTIKKSVLDIYGWKANPWVWVIEFERCEKPGKEKA